MNKKYTTIIGAAILTVAMSAVVFAASPSDRMRDNENQMSRGYGASCCDVGNGSGFMMDENGRWLDKAAFTEKLDQAIKDKRIDAADRDFYLRMHENRGNGMMGGNGNGMMDGYGRHYRGANA